MTMSDKPQVRIAQLGIGYWGPNILRSLRTLHPDAKVVAIADPDSARRDKLEHSNPDIEFYSEADYLIERGDCASSELIVVRSAKTKRHFSQLTDSLHCPPTSSTTVDSVASSRPVFSV